MAEIKYGADGRITLPDSEVFFGRYPWDSYIRALDRDGNCMMQAYIGKEGNFMMPFSFDWKKAHYIEIVRQNGEMELEKS